MIWPPWRTVTRGKGRYSPAAAAACPGRDGLGRLGDLAQPPLVLADRHDILTCPELSADLAGVLPTPSCSSSRPGT